MTVFLHIAFRNLLRNKKRSLITLSAVTFGLAALVFLRGFVFGAQRQMLENVTATLTSDAQIAPKALENIYNTNAAIEDPEAIRKILRSDPRILGFAERILGGGIVSSANTSMPTIIGGIDVEHELAIGSRRTVVRGHLLKETDVQGIAVGEKMRQILGVDIGEKVVVTAQDYYGSLTGGGFTLVGTFETGNDQIDNGIVLMLNPTAQRLLSFDHRISKFALRIDPRYDFQDVVRDLRGRIQDSGLSVLTWEDLLPMLAQLLRFQNGMVLVVILIVLTVVAVGILNTLMMSIVERTREFGLMMALGTKPSQVVLQVTLESLMLTIFGSALGTLIGVSLVLYFGHVGLDLSRFIAALQNFLIGSRVYPKVDWFYLFVSLAVVMVSNVLVSLYPAWRAGRLEPVQAMRQAG